MAALIYFLVFALTLLITYQIKQHTLAKGLLDIPNDRSSHTIPTPRGGGLAVVIVAFISLLLIHALSDIDNSIFYTLSSLILLLSIVGWYDDKLSISAKIRFAIQFLVASIAIGFIGSINYINFGIASLNIAYISIPFTLLFIVYFINMYNFMDGIDGIITSHSVISGLFLAIWFYFLQEKSLATFCLVLSAANLGFLYWNFSPAKIFFGDVGSTTMGGVFAVLGVYLFVEHDISIVMFIGLFILFIVDTISTIFRRALRGEKIWQAHREHLYQKLSRYTQSHALVSGFTCMTSILIGLFLTYLFWQMYLI